MARVFLAASSTECPTLTKTSGAILHLLTRVYQSSTRAAAPPPPPQLTPSAAVVGGVLLESSGCAATFLHPLNSLFVTEISFVIVLLNFRGP